MRVNTTNSVNGSKRVQRSFERNPVNTSPGGWATLLGYYAAPVVGKWIKRVDRMVRRWEKRSLRQRKTDLVLLTCLAMLVFIAPFMYQLSQRASPPERMPQQRSIPSDSALHPKKGKGVTSSHQ